MLKVSLVTLMKSLAFVTLNSTWKLMKKFP